MPGYINSIEEFVIDTYYYDFAAIFGFEDG